MLATFLQNELLTLSTEAKRKNPEIKDAAERLLFLIRSLKEKQPSPDLSLELSKTEDTLSPFLLSFETKNPKLVVISVGCIQKLISHNAIAVGSLDIVLKALADSSINTQDLQLKVLQTILPLVTNYPQVHGTTLSTALLLCFKLQDSKVAVVSSSAVATFRQLILYVFEKLLEQVKDNPAQRSSTIDRNEPGQVRDLSVSTGTTLPLKEFEKDALYIFQDLCLLTAGDSGTFLKLPSMPKTIGLELLEAVMSTTHQLFLIYPDLMSLVRDKVCPTVIKYFSEKAEFPLTVRLMRVCKVLIKYFNKVLAMQCEVFLSLFSKILESGTFPNWQRILVLECYKSFAGDGVLQRNIFDVYDANQHSANVYSEMVHGICSVIFGAHNYLLYYTETSTDQFGLSVQNASMKIPCMEHLEKNEPPVFPDVYPIYLAYQSITLLVDTQAEFILPILMNRDEDSKAEQSLEKEIFMGIEMAKTAGPGLWYALTILSVSSTDDEIFQRVLITIERYCTIVGLLGLVSYRDSILGTLCKISISSQLPIEITVNDLPSDIPPFNFSNIHIKNQMYSLSDRNIQFLVSLIQATELLVEVMDSKSWFAVLETLQLADFFLFSRAFKRLESTNTMIDLNPTPKEARLRSNTTTAATHIHPGFLESYITKTHLHPSTENLASLFSSVSKKMYEGTKLMKIRSFTEFMRALCRLAQETATCPVQIVSTTGKEIKANDEKSYAVGKIVEVTMLNLTRLVDPEDFSVFDLIVNQLTNVAHSPGSSSGIRTQVCTSFGDILITITQDPVFEKSSVELHVLDTIKSLMALDLKTPLDQPPEQEMLIRSFLPEVRRLGMDVVNRLLQSSGQYIREGWFTVFDIIYHTLQSTSTRKIKKLEQSRIFDSSAAIAIPMSPSMGLSESPSGIDPPPTSQKVSSALKVGFSSVQLVCTDFLSSLSPVALSRCIETVAAFGAAPDDLNISLTAVGLLWSLCDYILTSKHKLEKEGSAVLVENSTSVDEALTDQTEPLGVALDLDLLNQPLSSKTMDTLWMFLLGKLSDLCSDDRPEVRNSANQTLFRTLGMNGQRLTLSSWNLCINNVLFPLLEKIQDNSSQQSLKPLAMEKQWSESKILTVSGVTKCLTDFLPVLVELKDFDRQWLVFLNFIKDTCLNSAQDVTLITLKNFKTLVQYVKPNTEQVLPPNLAKRVDSLWFQAFQIWIKLGQAIIDGADENTWAENEKSFYPVVEWSNDRQPSLLQGPFTQECLSQYVSLIFDLYPVIMPQFKLHEFDLVTSIWQSLILYHSKPPQGATQSRIRSDFVNDTDTMTPTQSQFIDFLTGKVEFRDIPEIERLIYVLLADATLYPFIPFAEHCPNKTPDDEKKAPIYVSPCCKKHTYIAIARRAMNLIQTQFDKSTDKTELFTSGAFEHILVCLQLPLKYKYDCPSVGTKDQTPLWKTAASIMHRFLSESLFVLYELQDELDSSKVKAMYNTMIDSLEVYLLCKSQPSLLLSPEKVTDDEQIDLCLIQFIEKDMLVYFGRPGIKKRFLERLLRILLRIVGDDLHPIPISLDFKTSATLQSTVSSIQIASPTLLPTSPTPLPSAAVDVASFQLDPEQFSPNKERIAARCLQTLFYVCSDKTPGVDSDIRIANICLPMLIDQCKVILSNFARDRKISGKFPMPRSRNNEVILTLKGLSELVLRPGLPEECHGVISKEMVQSFIQSSTSAHLFQLYPTFCDLLGVVSGSLFVSNAGSTGELLADESVMLDLVHLCLSKIGEIFQ